MISPNTYRIMSKRLRKLPIILYSSHRLTSPPSILTIMKSMICKEVNTIICWRNTRNSGGLTISIEAWHLLENFRFKNRWINSFWPTKLLSTSLKKIKLIGPLLKSDLSYKSSKIMNRLILNYRCGKKDGFLRTQSKMKTRTLKVILPK